MATVASERKPGENPHNRNELVRDLINKRVRMTFYRRDPVNSNALGFAEGQRSPFDFNIVTVGFLVPIVCFLPKRNHLWGIQMDDGSFDMCFLSPTDSTEVIDKLGIPSKWDGKINGTYKIEVIE